MVGATNRPELLDAALIRPGRFDKIIYVPPPDLRSRQEILKVATSKTPLSPDVDLFELAEITPRFSGADLESLCKEAALNAMTEQGLDRVEAVTRTDFERVMSTFRPSISESMLKHYENLNIA